MYETYIRKLRAFSQKACLHISLNHCAQKDELGDCCNLFVMSRNTESKAEICSDHVALLGSNTTHFSSFLRNENLAKKIP